jgi:alpha-tubulin suppressor-like RCC1 family protein
MSHISTLSAGAPRLRWLAPSLCIFFAVFSLAGCGGKSHTTTPPVTIQMAPLSQTVSDGESATLVVEATNETPLTYQWVRDGVPIPGATDAVYVTPVLAAADPTVEYAVVVSDDKGTIKVVTATVTVQPVAPTLVSQLQSPTSATGQPTTFTVTAQGTQPLSYQWQRDGVDIPGANAPSFTPAPGDAGSTWNVVVGNTAGAVTSDDFTLPATGGGPVVLGMLQVGVAVPGQTLVISTTLAGDPPFAHQWLRNGVAIAGATGIGDSPLLQLTTPVLTATDNGVRYSVVVATAAGSVRSPDAVIYVSDVIRVAAGGEHSLAMSAQGNTVWAWGANRHGQLGLGSTASSPVPAVVGGLSGVKAIAAGADHSLALKLDGTVWAWGRNAAGALGDGTQTDRLAPQRVGGLDNVVAVATADGRSFALRADGTLWGWGENTTGALGIGTQNHALVPTRVGANVAGFSRIVQVAAGARHTLALSANGQVFAIGEVAVPLANGSTVMPSPTRVEGLSSIAGIAAGDGFSVALDINGRLWSWGANGSGQLGLGDTTPRAQPVAVTRSKAGSLLLPIVGMAAGHDFALARTVGGGLLAWGAGASGQLGAGNSVGASAPVPITGLSAPMVSIAAGGAHTLAVRTDGSVYAWGANADGQLGIRSSEALRTEPVQIPALDID